VKGTNPTEKAAQEKASKNWGKREAVSSIEWAPQIHRLISGAEEAGGFGRIPDHQEGVRCKAPRSEE
jgi:hypothetical protein